MKTKKIAVIGAGISGLCIAYWLEKAGLDVTVLEKTNHIGGSILTEKQDGFLIDLGPNSALETSVELKDLIDELGLGDEKIYGSETSNNRYVVKNGDLHSIPTSPGKFLKTKLFSTKAKLRLLREPFIKPTDGTDLSLADFVRYRLGQEFLDYAINPFVAGVYAGDPDNLSTMAAFPKLYALEQKYGSFIGGTIKGARARKKSKEVAKDRAKLFSFISGMHIFPQTLAAKLKSKVRLNTAANNLQFKTGKYHLSLEHEDKRFDEIYDMVILSVPADAQAKLLKNICLEKVKRISEIEYPPVAVVFTGFKSDDIKRDLDGFGYLIPKVEHKEILGSIWSSTIFPKRAPQGFSAFTTFVGGSRQPQNAHLDEEQLLEIVLKDINDLVGLYDKPVLTRIKLWKRAIPQYTMGYPEIQKMYNELENKNPGLYFAGNYRRGIGMGDSVLSAHETVQKIYKE